MKRVIMIFSWKNTNFKLIENMFLILLKFFLWDNKLWKNEVLI